MCVVRYERDASLGEVGYVGRPLACRWIVDAAVIIAEIILQHGDNVGTMSIRKRRRRHQYLVTRLSRSQTVACGAAVSTRCEAMVHTIAVIGIVHAGCEVIMLAREW